MIAAAGIPDAGAAQRSLNQRLPKVARVRRRSEFQLLQRSGRRVPGRCFLVVLDHGARSGSPQIGVTVTKKVGIAVVRNRLKRIVREIFRPERRYLAPSARFVVIAREAAARTPVDELRVELTGLLRRFRTTGAEGV